MYQTISKNGMMALDILCVNIRGLANPAKLLEICEKRQILGKNNETCIVIQETKIIKMKEEHEKILKKYKLKSEEVPAIGGSGGLLTIIPEFLQYQVLLKGTSCLALKISKNNQETILINTYINPKDFRAENFCACLEELGLEPTHRILIAGDFNAIDNEDIGKNDALNNSIKNNDIRILRYKRIIPYMNSLLLKDQVKEQNTVQPTHYDKRTKKNSRIDYIFSNCISDEQKIELFNITKTDHKCLFLRTHEERLDLKQSQWKLNDTVLDDRFRINEILKNAIPKLKNKLSLAETYDNFKANVRDDLRQLCIEKRNIEKAYERQLIRDIKDLEHERFVCNNKPEEINRIQKEIDRKNDEIDALINNQNRMQLNKIKNFYNEVNEGNPKQVKQLVSALRPSTRINKLKKDNGETINSQNDIVEEITTYYQNLYESHAPPSPNNYEPTLQQTTYLQKYFKRIENKLSTYDNTNINEDEITEFEVEQAILKLNNKSAPGPDGLTSNLYQTYKNFFIPLLTDLFNDIIRKKQVPPSFNLAIIKLIPKKYASEKVSDLRPISLINSDQKILSHVLTKRIKPLFDHVIGNHQYAHLTDRNIHTALTKIRQYSTSLRSKEALCALDFSKAFDCVDRGFLMAILKYLPIPETTINLIEALYQNTISIIDVNSEFSKPIKITRGVRQGCPLSAILFILVIEPLLDKIQRSRKIKSTNHQKSIAFADDITVSIKTKSINKLIKFLDDFEMIAGLAINYDKSEMLTKNHNIFFRNPEKTLKTVNRVKVLGVFITTKYGIDCNTKNKIETILSQATKFTSKNMSFRARAINLETFILSKITYQLRHFTKNKTYMKKLNAKMVDGFWNHKKHNVNQEIAHLERKEGGIGLKKHQSKSTSRKTHESKSIPSGSQQP